MMMIGRLRLYRRRGSRPAKASKRERQRFRQLAWTRLDDFAYATASELRLGAVVDSVQRSHGLSPNLAFGLPRLVWIEGLFG